MTLENTHVIHEMDRHFERMHARLDQRLQQLIRQVKGHSSSTIHSHQRKNPPTLIFSPAHQFQLEESIEKFGCLTISTSVRDVRSLSNRTLTPSTIDSVLPMRKTTSASTITSDNDTTYEHCRVIGKHGRRRGQLSNPQDVLILPAPRQALLVSDTINQNVQVFSTETGLCTGALSPSANSRQTPLRRPIGLSHAFRNDTITCLVADYDQHSISTWTIDESGNGKLVKRFGQQSLVGPKGLCASSQSQRIVVADNKANSICLFESSGEFLYRFGTRGAELHELAGPHYVRFTEQDNDRHVIVTDFYNNCVKIFDLERHGQFVTSFGSTGTGNGAFQAPTGLAIDHERGYVFVSDWGNNRIQVFDRQGSFVRIIELPTSDMLYGPQGLDYEPTSQSLAIANSGKYSVLLVRVD